MPLTGGYSNVGYLNIAGAETGNLDEAMSYVLNSNSNPPVLEVQTATVRSGTYAYHLYTGQGSGTGALASQTYLRFGLIKSDGTQWSPNTTATAPVDFYLRLWINVKTRPTSGFNEDIVTIRDSTGARKCSVAIKDDGNVAFYDAARTLIGTGTTPISANTWTRLDVHAGTGTTAAAEIRLNGTSVVSGTFNNSNPCSDFSIGTERTSGVSTIEFYFDDIALRDDQYPADGRVKILKPNATGSTAQWALDSIPPGNYAGTDYNAVNDLPLNTSYGGDNFISTSTNGQVHLFGLDDTAGIINSGPNCLKLTAYPKSATASTGGCVLRMVGAATADTTGTTWPTSQPGFGTIVQNLQQLNNGSAWTTAAVDSLQVGIVNSSGGSVKVELHAIYLMVDYTPVTTPTAPVGLTVAAQGTGGIRISWTADSNDGIYIERSTDNATWTQITSVLSGQTASLNWITAANTLYYYRARGYIGGSTSSYTASVSATSGATQLVTQFTDGFDAGSIGTGWTAQEVTPIAGNWTQANGLMSSVGSSTGGEKGLILSSTTTYRNTTGTQEVLCKIRLNSMLGSDGRSGVYLNYQVGSNAGFMCGFHSSNGTTLELDVLDDGSAHHTTAFTAVIGKWYWLRAKVTTNNAVTLKVWEDGTTEPGTVTYSISGLNTRSTNNYPGINGAGNKADFDEFIIIAPTNTYTRTQTTNALKRATQTKSHTTNALLKRGGTLTHATDGYLISSFTGSTATGYPQTIANDGASGVQQPYAWSNPSQAVAPWLGGNNFTGGSPADGATASVSVAYNNSAGLPGLSQGLQCLNCGLTIPAGSTIVGISVALYMYGNSASGNTGADAAVTLYKAGVPVGTTKTFPNNVALPSSYALRSFGSQSDLWGTTWTAADLNGSGFGFSYSAQEISEVVDPTDGPGTVYVDYTSVTVYYIAPKSVAHTTDVSLRGTIARAHTTNALVRATTTKSHTSNSLLKSLSVRSHNTDSSLRATQTRSHNTGGLIRSSATRSHSSDASTKAANTRSWTTDSLKRAANTRSHTSGSYLQGSSVRSHTTGSTVVAKYANYNFGPVGGTPVSGYTYVDNSASSLYSVAKGYGWVTYGTPSALTRPGAPDTLSSQIVYNPHFAFQVDLPAGTYSVQVYTGDTGFVHDSDVVTFNGTGAINYSTGSNQYITLVQTVTVTGTSLVVDWSSVGGDVNAVVSALRITNPLPTFTYSHSTDATLRSTGTRSFTTNSLLKSTGVARQHTADASLRVANVRPHNSDAVLQLAGQARSHTTGALVRQATARTHATDALAMAVGVTRSHTTGTLLRSSGVTRAHSSDALKKLVTTRSFTTDARVGSLSVGSRSRTQRIGTRTIAFGDYGMKERQQGTTNYPISVLMVLSSDHVTGTGTVTPTITISKNGGPWAAPSGALVYDTYGWFEWTPDPADRDTLGELRIHVTAPGCDPYDEKYEIVAYDPFLGANTQTERNAIADTFLTRDWAAITMTVASRSALNALRFLRNKWALNTGGQLAVAKEDDNTASPAWTAQTQSQSGADPITGSTPTS